MRKKSKYLLNKNKHEKAKFQVPAPVYAWTK